MKDKFNPRVRQALTAGARENTEDDRLMEMVAQAEKREAIRKFQRMTDDQLIKIGAKFGLGSSQNALRTKDRKELYIEHLSRIEAYKIYAKKAFQ